jgi:hypothetical protein
MVLLDSTGFKDSKGILFAIFGSTERKIWFLQDWIEFWFRFLKRNSIWTRDRHLAVSDWLIPFRVDYNWEPLDLTNLERPRSCTDSVLSETIRSVWSRSNERDESGEMLTGLARFPTKNPARACRGGTPAMLRWPPMQTESWTVISETRGSRGCASRCRLRPGTFPRGGWSSVALWWLRVHDAMFDLLRRNTNRGCEEERHVVGNQIGESRRTGAYWKGQIWPEITCRNAEFRRRISPALRRFERGKRGEWQRESRASYRCSERSKRAGG